MPVSEKDTVTSDDSIGEWVIVQKRTITILIPPAPLASPQSKSPEIIRGRRRGAVNRSSPAMKYRRHKNSKVKLMRPAVSPANDAESSKPEESQPHLRISSLGINGSKDCNVEPKQPFDRIKSNGLETFGPSDCLRAPIGAPSVANRRLRAMNLERRLRELGGPREWLLSQGLGRFITVFEREKLGCYQLANITTRGLREIGATAVGPRRKLLHAINRLCQPTLYFEA